MILQELIVKLALNSQDVEAKAGSATKKLDDIEKSGKGAEAGVKGIGKASKDTSGELVGLTGKLGAFLALLGGTVALKTFIHDAIETNTQLAFLSRNLGIDAQSISAWSIASQELGGSAGDLQGALKMLAQEGTNLALLGDSRLMPFFSRMRIALPNPQIPGDELRAFRQIAEYAERAMKLGESRTTMHGFLADQGFTEGQINLILRGTAALDAAIAKAKKWGPSPQETADAQVMTAQLADLSAQFTKVGYEMLSVITPALEVFFAKLQEIGAWLQKHPVFADIVVGAALVAAALGTLTLALEGIVAAFTALSAGAPILLVAAAVGALGSAILLAANDYEIWKKGGISEFDWSDLEHRIHAVADAFETVGHKIAFATEKFGDWLEANGIHVKEFGKTALALGKAAAGEYLTLQGDILGVHLNAPASIQAEAEGIAKAEGFGKPDAIPTKANNPGAIEYGPFAKSHGATDSMTAAGGKQIAVFPDVATGMKALIDLVQSKYSGMPLDTAMATYTGLPTGQELSNYIATVQQAMNSAALAGPGKSTGTSVAGDKNTVSIAHMDVHTQTKSAEEFLGSLRRRGMDWLSWGAPANGASQ